MRDLKVLNFERNEMYASVVVDEEDLLNLGDSSSVEDNVRLAKVNALCCIARADMFNFLSG